MCEVTINISSLELKKKKKSVQTFQCSRYIDSQHNSRGKKVAYQAKTRSQAFV